ncbi:NADPH-dependent FMN reductase [Streptomyces massasporeus]|uniref:NADPH-dependent FMN reductase n=1 Tax=Streptomyces massasporeus TaxID=67324 RepID=UPI00382D840A
MEQLRVVMAEVNTTTIRNTVSFHDAWSRFDEDGACKDPAAGTAAKALLDQLARWGHALRDAKVPPPLRRLTTDREKGGTMDPHARS